MCRPDGVEAAEGVVQAKHFDLDAKAEAEACDTATVEAAQFLTAHVAIACTQVETLGDQELRSKNGVPEHVVKEGKLGLDCVSAQVDLWWRVFVVKDQVGRLQIGGRERKAQRHVLETLRDADLDFKWQRTRYALGRFPLGEVEADIFEDHTGGKQFAFAHVSAAQIHAECKVRAVAAHVAVDKFEVGTDAKVIHLAGTAHNKGEVGGREAPGLVAVDIGLDHFAIAQVLDSGMETADIFKGVRVANITVGDVAEVVAHRGADGLMHRIVAQGGVLIGHVEVMVHRGDIAATQGGNPRRGTQVQEIKDMPSTDLGSGEHRQASEEYQRPFLHGAKIGSICQTWECKN